MNELKDMLLQAPEEQIDASAREDIRLWSNPSTALEILRTLDTAIHYSFASDFVVSIMQTMLDIQMDAENINHATSWRKLVR